MDECEEHAMPLLPFIMLLRRPWLEIYVAVFAKSLASQLSEIAVLQRRTTSMDEAATVIILCSLRRCSNARFEHLLRPARLCAMAKLPTAATAALVVTGSIRMFLSAGQWPLK